jgi:hypothetical protein
VSHDPDILLAEYMPACRRRLQALQAQLKAALAGALEGKA